MHFKSPAKRLTEDKCHSTAIHIQEECMLSKNTLNITNTSLLGDSPTLKSDFAPALNDKCVCEPMHIFLQNGNVKMTVSVCSKLSCTVKSCPH